MYSMKMKCTFAKEKKRMFILSVLEQQNIASGKISAIRKVIFPHLASQGLNPGLKETHLAV